MRKLLLFVLFLLIGSVFLFKLPVNAFATCTGTLNGVSHQFNTGEQMCYGASYVGQFCTSAVKYDTCQSTGSWAYTNCAANTACGYASSTNISCYGACAPGTTTTTSPPATTTTTRPPTTTTTSAGGTTCQGTLNGLSHQFTVGQQMCYGASYVGQFCTSAVKYDTCQSSGSWAYSDCSAGTACGYTSTTNISCYASCVGGGTTTTTIPTTTTTSAGGTTHTCYTSCNSYAQSGAISDSCYNHGWQCAYWSCSCTPNYNCSGVCGYIGDGCGGSVYCSNGCGTTTTTLPPSSGYTFYGTVWQDLNHNGVYDKGEGVNGVNIKYAQYFASGQVINYNQPTSDMSTWGFPGVWEGAYAYGGDTSQPNHILTLDTTTLPAGYTVSPSSPVSVTLNPSTNTRVNWQIIPPGGTPPPPSGTGNVFVTSTTYNGNLGGLAGADAKCQTRAAAAGLSGTWVAFLSDDTNSAANRLTHSTSPYIRMDGVTVANDWAGLTSGSLLAPINKTEYNTTVSNGSLGFPLVFTDSLWTGVPALSNFACNNWTSSLNTVNGWGGNANLSSGGWVSASNGAVCWGNPLASLYCFQQPITPPPPTTYNITGSVFLDSNKNGIKDPGESNYTGGIAGEISVPAIPSGATVTINSAAGTYSIDNLPSGSSFFVNYSMVTAKNQGYLPTVPNGSPPTYQVQVGPCVVGSSTGSTPPCDPSGNGSITGLDFGINNSVPWIQSVGGDFYQNGFNDQIPSTATSTAPPVPYGGAGPFASVFGVGGETPGIIYMGSTGNPLTNFGKGSASQQGWIAGGQLFPETYITNGAPLKTSYGRINSLIDEYGKRTDVKDLALACGAGGVSDCNLSGALKGIYTTDKPVTFSSSPSTIEGNKSIIILIKNNLNINGKVWVKNGSTLFITVSGDITVDPSVGEALPSTYCTSPQGANAQSTGCSIEGYYSADQNFTIKGNGASSCLTSGKDLRLNIGGSVVADAAGDGGGFSYNTRDLCDPGSTYPVLSITERPDFILNSPEFFKTQRRIWQELTP